MKKLDVNQLEMILEQVRLLKAEHPKADVFYDVERSAVQVLYPLPNDFYKIHDIEISYRED